MRTGFARLRGTALMLVGSAVIVAGLWGWWDYHADGLVEAQIERMKQAGEPVDLDEWMEVPAVPDAENRAKLWTAAFNAIGNVDCPSSSNMTYSGPPFPAEWFAMEKAAVTANANCLELSRRARALKGLDWGWRSAQGVMPLLPKFNYARSLTNQLSDAALYAHFHDRDDATAIERWEDALQLARDVGRTPVLIAYLVQTGQEAKAMSDIREAAPDLLVGEATDHVRPASRKAVMGLIAELADEDTYVSEEEYDLQGDEAFSIGYRQSSGFVVLAPLWTLQLARRVAAMGDLAGQVDATRGETAAAQPLTPPGSLPPEVIPGLQPKLLLDTEWKMRVDRRAAEISLAVRLFRIDHHRWPKDLQELVPTYLAMVPRDPFLPGTPPVHYVVIHDAPPKGMDRPMIYFDVLGKDGGTKPPTTRPMYDDWGSSRSQQWFDLSRW